VPRGRIGRVERGEPDQLTVELAAQMAAVLGLQLSVTLHPNGDPVRDAAHLALLQRCRARMHHNIHWRSEVPVPIEGDLRSADAVITAGEFEAFLEAETRIDDVQALLRKIDAKQRDLRIGRVILLIADTRHNRRVLSDVPALRERFPLSTRACFAALNHGRDPGRDAHIIL
jgi:hypothetical protein